MRYEFLKQIEIPDFEKTTMINHITQYTEELETRDFKLHYQ